MNLEQAFSGDIQIALDGTPQRWRVRVNGPGEIVVSVDGIPLWVANGNMDEELRFAGETFMVQGTKNRTYGLRISGRALQPAEPINDDPAYVPPVSNNYLAKLRARLRQQMGVRRESFLDADTPYPGYEIPDEFEGDEFEEEEAVAKARDRQSNEKHEDNIRPDRRDGASSGDGNEAEEV